MFFVVFFYFVLYVHIYIWRICIILKLALDKRTIRNRRVQVIRLVRYLVAFIYAILLVFVVAAAAVAVVMTQDRD